MLNLQTTPTMWLCIVIFIGILWWSYIVYKRKNEKESHWSDSIIIPIGGICIFTTLMMRTSLTEFFSRIRSRAITEKRTSESESLELLERESESNYKTSIKSVDTKSMEMTPKESIKNDTIESQESSAEKSRYSNITLTTYA
jgi:mannitol-specific phosphotransferase system IIBC component